MQTSLLRRFQRLTRSTEIDGGSTAPLYHLPHHAGLTRVALASGAPANPLQTLLFDVQVAIWASSSVPGDDVQLVVDSGRRRLRSASDRTCSVSFDGPITVLATEVSLLLDPEYGMLYLQNYDTTTAFYFLGAIWSRICLSRAPNHGVL